MIAVEPTILRNATALAIGVIAWLRHCAGVASVFVAATGLSSASYSVKPLAVGSCTARVVDEAGHTLSIPIVVR